VWTAAERTVALTGQILDTLWQIINGTRTAEELGGPLRIAQLSGQMAQDGWISMVFFMAALSINLGLINLFPIPMLDGGHLSFYILEAVRGRPLDQKVQEYGFRFGMVLVLLLMIFATWNDLVQLEVVQFFKRLVT
jgi:regulator of sigma E protease